MSTDRLEVLMAPERLGLTVAETCDRYGISRQTFYRWQRRYQQEGVKGLDERPPGPKQPPRSQAIEPHIFEIHRQHPNWGARRIHRELTRRGLTDLPAVATIHASMKRNGLTATPGQPDTTPPRGARTRQALIDTAMELWSTTGWRGTGITAVAQRVGVSDAGLLHHFGTKENFLFAVVAELDRRAQAYWDTTGPPTGLDLIHQLPDWVRPYHDPGIPHRMGKLRIMLQAENLDPTSPAHDYFTLRHHYLHQAFADAIRTGQANGDIRPDANPDLIATQILAFLMGIEFHNNHGPQHIDPGDAAEDFTNRLIHDLTHHPPSN